MFCVTCGTPNPDSASFCSRCGNTLKSAPTPPPPMPAGAAPAAFAPAPAYMPPPSAPTPAPPKTMHWFAVVSMGLVLGLMAFAAFNTPIPQLPNQDQEIGYRFGTFLWPALVALLVAWPVAGRKKKRRPNLFATLFCSIGLGMLALSLVGNLGATGSMQFQGFETTDQKISRLMREAAGLQPVHQPLFGESKTDTRMRDLFRDLVTLNKQYHEQLKALDTKDVAVLGTPASFADPDAAQAGLTELHAAYDLDSLQEQRVQQLLDDFKTRFNDFSPRERDEFLKGVDQGLSHTMPVRRKALDSEKAWVDSVDDIYGFARANHSSITLSSSDQVAITDSQVREEFNTRVRAMNSRRSEFLEAEKAVAAMQNSSLQKFGITREQAGAK